MAMGDGSTGGQKCISDRNWGYIYTHTNNNLQWTTVHGNIAKQPDTKSSGISMLIMIHTSNLGDLNSKNIMKHTMHHFCSHPISIWSHKLARTHSDDGEWDREQPGGFGVVVEGGHHLRSTAIPPLHSWGSA